ncbi:MAG: tRNA pseudouridine(13) synthase TruD [Desulfurococcaceae archaeon]
MNTSVYLHPLDYVTGMKHYLTDLKVNLFYELSPQTFHVEELVDWNNLGFNDSKGEYVVLEIRKSMIDTIQVVNNISRRLSIPFENIIYLGLKDKYASATQFFFIKKQLFNHSVVESICSDKVTIKFRGFVSRKPRRKDLLGNKFLVKLDYVDETIVSRVKELARLMLEKGLPNYYGYQRFGFHRPNTHLLGLYIISHRFNDLTRCLLRDTYFWEDPGVVIKRSKNCFDGLIYENIIYTSRSILKALSRLNRLTKGIYVEAYVAYLYNQLLNKVIESKGWVYLDEEYPTAGCRDAIDLYRDVVEIDGLEPSNIPSTMCWFRKGLFKPRIRIEKNGGSLNLSFTLSRGEYATVVLRELFKDGLKLY